jgi:hypothetical protein
MRLLYCCIIISFCFLFGTSCLSTYGDNITRRYTPLVPDTSKFVPSNKAIAVYFDGESIPFEYIKLGIVEVTGNQCASTESLLNHLKYEAFKCGANAVIATKDGYSDRQSGMLFSKTPPTNYSAHVYSGIAVKVKDGYLADSLSRIGSTSFINKAVADDQAYGRKSSNQLIGSFVFGIILTGVVIYFLATK